MTTETVPTPLPPPPPGALRLLYAAISDVGRVRKDNQDSGYAGPWILTVCDGVGGAARGDIASAAAVGELRGLDGPPDGDLLDRLAEGIHDAHTAIGALVDDDPALNGTSTTATVVLFDGGRIAVGHVGDSRAYLFRGGELSQLTKDHTFVQSLIDEGRITEAEARVHPHRNLILKALDGVHESEPDLFVLEVVEGDRLLLCSDGACGVLDDGRLADILSMGTPDFAAVELVRASLEAGSSDNVTCVVADARSAEAAGEDPAFGELEPLLVGAAAEQPRPVPRARTATLFRGHRSGDTGELEPVQAELPEGLPADTHAIRADPLGDAEEARYAPRAPKRFRWLKRLLALVVVLGVLWVVGALAYGWTQRQYYVGESDGRVVIYRGVDLAGLTLSEVYEDSDVQVDLLRDIDVERVNDGVAYDNLDDARSLVEQLAALQDEPVDETDTSTDAPADPSEAPSSDRGEQQQGQDPQVSEPGGAG